MKRIGSLTRAGRRVLSSVIAITMITALCMTSALISGAAAPETVLESTGMAKFTSDAATKGNWYGKYGSDGFVFPAYNKPEDGGKRTDLVNLPSYIDSVDFVCATEKNSGRTMWREAADLTEGLAIGKDNTGIRRVAYVFDGKSLTVKIKANDDKIHRAAFYAAKVGQTMNYQMFKPGTTEAVSDKISLKVTAGTYVTAEFKGSVDVVINGEDNTKAVALGVFFDTDAGALQSFSIRPQDGSSVRPYTGKFKMQAATVPAGLGNNEFTWSADDTNIAEVDENGEVNVKAKGAFTVTAKSKATGEEQRFSMTSLALSATSAEKTETMSVNGVYVLRNNKVCIAAKNGVYSVYDAAGLPYVLNAAFSVNGIKSTVGTAQTDFADGKIRITRKSDNTVGTVLDIAIKGGKGEVYLTPGVVNETGKEIKIMEAYSMIAEASANSGIYAGPNPGKDHSILTGEANWGKAQVSFDVSTPSSKNNLLISYRDNPNKESFVLGGLTTYEFQNEVRTIFTGAASYESAGREGIDARIRTFDNTGKLVDAGKTYFADQSMINFTEKNPYTALENYAEEQAKAMKVDLGEMDDTIYQSLYYVENYGGTPGANKADFAVEEANRVKESGLNNYAKFNIGLEPDTYTNPNEQMWWDDAHWKSFGHLTSTYPTLVSMGDAVKAAGQGFGLYMQPFFRSKDYVAKYPTHMLDNNKTNTEVADYTDPDFIAHMKDVYTNIKNAGTGMIMYDYTNQYRNTDNKWPDADREILGITGGFEDKYATAVSAYRNMYSLSKEVVGKDFKNIENAWTTKGEEVATGLIDYQRTGDDSVKFTPEIARTSAIQWYRNRKTKQVYSDVNIFEDSKDARRAQITAVGLMFGKFSLGESIKDISADKLWDITRVLPMPIDGQSPRPVGLLENKNALSQIYDYKFAGNNNDHLLLFWNTNKVQGTEMTAKLGQDSAFGGVGLNPDKSYDVWDFWNWEYIGRVKGSDDLTVSLRENEMKTLAVREVTSAPSVLSTNRHVLQGAVDTKNVTFDATASKMSGTFSVAANDTYKAIISFGDRDLELLDVAIKTAGVTASYKVIDEANKLIEITIDSTENKDVDFEISFKSTAPITTETTTTTTTTTTTETSTTTTATTTEPTTTTTTVTVPTTTTTTATTITAPTSTETTTASVSTATTTGSTSVKPSATTEKTTKTDAPPTAPVETKAPTTAAPPAKDNPNTGSASGAALGILFSVSALAALCVRKRGNKK